MCQALLPPSLQSLSRSGAPGAKRRCRHAYCHWLNVRHSVPSDAAAMCAAIDFEARLYVSRDAALHAAPDTKWGTMRHALLSPYTQLLI